MSLRRAKKYFVTHMVARVVFLFSATIMCVGMILDVIMVVNIVLPYLRVVNYVEANCTHVSTVVANRDCTDCLRANTTTEPCIQTIVNYKFETNNTEVAITTLLRYNEYNVISDDICSYKTSYTSFYWQNEAEVDRFRNQYGVPGNYVCYYDPTSSTRVIVRKEHSDFDVLHAILWPSLAIVVGFVLVIIFYCWVGCDIWGSRIATVMWDKSLKRIEMEQEIRRRTNNNFNRKNYHSGW